MVRWRGFQSRKAIATRPVSREAERVYWAISDAELVNATQMAGRLKYPSRQSMRRRLEQLWRAGWLSSYVRGFQEQPRVKKGGPHGL